MRTKSKFFSALILLTSLGLICMMIACNQETPMGAEQTDIHSSGQVTILKVNDAPGSSLQKLYTQTKLIDDDGGSIIFGNDWSGISYIKFPEDAISKYAYPNGVGITFAWQSEGLLQAAFYPEGLTFNRPVYIRLSYKEAEFTGYDIDESRLGIYYYNPDSQIWELVSSTVNSTEKYVEGYIKHFSLYAIGME